MTKHLPLLLFVGLAFWGCGDSEESLPYKELDWIYFEAAADYDSSFSFFLNDTNFSYLFHTDAVLDSHIFSDNSDFEGIKCDTIALSSGDCHAKSYRWIRYYKDDNYIMHNNHNQAENVMDTSVYFFLNIFYNIQYKEK